MIVELLLENIKGILTFVSAAGFLSLAYSFLTTTAQRRIHHRKIRFYLFSIHRGSWLSQFNKTSKFVLRLLDLVYGPSTHRERFFSKAYFNHRAWKASFSMATFYVIGFFVVIAPITQNDSIYDVLRSIAYYTSVTASIVIIYILIKRLVLKLPVRDKNYKPLSMVLPIPYIILIAIINQSPFSNGTSFILILVVIPLVFVWSYGPRGLLIYLSSVLFLFCTAIPAMVVLKKISITSEPIQYFVIISYCASFSIAAHCLSKKREELLKPLYLSAIVIAVFCLSIIESDFGFLNPSAVVAILAISLVLLAMLIFYGFVFANSLADLFSANLSRWLFWKMYTDSSWKNYSASGVLDIVGAFGAIYISAVLIGGVLALGYPILAEEGILSIAGLERAISEASGERIDIRTMSLRETANTIANAWIMSAPLFPAVFIPNTDELFNKWLIEYDAYKWRREGNSQLISIFWFFYLTVAIPTLLHLIAISVAIIIKSMAFLIQTPSKQLHRLLIESETTTSGAIINGAVVDKLILLQL